MISVVVTLAHEEPAVVDTLTALVEAVADGTVRDAVIAAPPGLSFAHAVAEGAGCRLAEGEGVAGEIAALDQCRSEWILRIAAGMVPVGLWSKAVEDHCAARGAAEARAGLFRVADAYGMTPWTRALAQRWRAASGRIDPAQPVLAPRPTMAAVVGGRRTPSMLLPATAADRRRRT
jgi:hypothetical protein